MGTGWMIFDGRLIDFEINWHDDHQFPPQLPPHVDIAMMDDTTQRGWGAFLSWDCDCDRTPLNSNDFPDNLRVLIIDPWTEAYRAGLNPGEGDVTITLSQFAAVNGGLTIGTFSGTVVDDSDPTLAYPVYGEFEAMRQ